MPEPARHLDLPGAVAAVDGLIYNALHLVGARLRTSAACPRGERSRAKGIPPAQMHATFAVDDAHVTGWGLLDGAWVRVPEIAARYGLDPDCLTQTLDDYCRALIAARLPHSFDDVPRLLRHSSCGLVG